MAAVVAAAAALSSLSFPSSFFHTPTIRLHSLCRLPLHLSAVSAPNEFNISFAPSPPKPKFPKTLAPDRSPATPLPMPWIARDENGNLKHQTSPSARFLHVLAEAKSNKKAQKKPKDNKRITAAAGAAASGPTAAPKYSKAARRFYNEKFREPPQRLSKVLAAAGVASRRSSEELIFEGKVTVNGSVCTSPQTRVDLLKDSIYVNGGRLSKKLPPKLYFALNKPKGYICSSGEESKSVVSLFDEYWKSWFTFIFWAYLRPVLLLLTCINKEGCIIQKRINPGVPQPRLFTVGRLDVATTGLIFVTNDGDFAQRLSHPSSNVTKEYIATIEGALHRRHLIAISEGTLIEGVKCIPDSVELLPSQPGVSRPRLRIVVHEGRNHEVRELVKNAALQLHSLKRVRVGAYRLPSDLGLGKYAVLKEAEIKLLTEKTQKII